MSRPRVLIALALAAVAAAVAAAHAQEPAVEVFLDRVEVDVVNLEVVVTDRRGNPIRGLTRDDFVVLEDGKPVELTNFYAIEGARREVAAEQPAALPGVAAPADADPLPMLLPEQRLNLALVIDNANVDVEQPQARPQRAARAPPLRAATGRPGDGRHPRAAGRASARASPTTRR
jgi:hypothetical protein